MKRQIEFDIAKGIAAYLVVLGHLLDQIAGKNIILITFCHMPVFFLISGYFLNKSIKKQSGGGGKQVVIRKFQRLLIPYLFWSFISFVANVVVLLVRDKISMGNIIGEFVNIFLFARSVWFLIAILFSELICMAAWWVVQKYKCNIYVLLVIAWLVISILPVRELFSIYSIKWLFPFLILGMLCEEYDIYNKLSSEKFWIAGLIFLMGSCWFYNEEYFNNYILFTYDSIHSVFIGLLYYVLSILSIYMVLCLALWINKTIPVLGKYLAIAGCYSLEIYVMHMFFIKFILIVPTAIMNNNISIYAYFALYGAIITILIILFSKYALEKIKLFRVVVGRLN